MGNDLTVGIPTYAGSERMNYLLESMVRTDPDGYNIVLLDDGSPDGGKGVESLAEQYSADYIRFDQNRGIPAAWNALVEYHNSKYTILFNDDILVTPGWRVSMQGFLERNPMAGSASFPQYFASEDMYDSILKDGLHNGEMTVVPRHPQTKEPQPDQWRHSQGHRSGRIMCPAGSAFGFTREKYDLVKSWNKTKGLTGGFPEEYLSFHEESEFGTVLAMHKFPSYGLTFPQVWHMWSATFRASPELNSGYRMQHSRRMYCATFDVPEEHCDNPFKYTHPRYMDNIPPYEVEWLMPDGTWKRETEPDTRKWPER
jgi:GT2 family glycosyltransferase